MTVFFQNDLFALAFDANGNRTMSGYTTGDGAGGDLDANRVTSDGTWDYTYDDEGNMIGRALVVGSETWTFAYDNRNQLIQVDRKSDGTTIDFTIVYTYDAWGNRIAKSVDDGTGANVDQFVIDGWNPTKSGALGLARFDIWADLDGSSTVVTQYLRGNTGQLIGRLGLLPSNEGTYWYLLDILGSVRGITNKWGQLANEIDYDAFGNITRETHPELTGQYGFAGGQMDREFGAVHFGARIYITATGTWMQEDPSGFAAGDPNLHRYVGNGPTNGVDPSGLLDELIGRPNLRIGAPPAAPRPERFIVAPPRPGRAGPGPGTGMGAIIIQELMREAAEQRMEDLATIEAIADIMSGRAARWENARQYPDSAPVPEPLANEHRYCRLGQNTRRGDGRGSPECLPRTTSATSSAPGQAIAGVAGELPPPRIPPIAMAGPDGPDPARRRFTINQGQQNKHIIDTNEYKAELGRSELTHPDPQSLLDRGALTGQAIRGEPGVAGSKEVVDFGENIGTYFNNGIRVGPTTRGVIHYGANSRAHIVPAPSVAPGS